MTPAARVAAAIGVLEEWRGGGVPLDRVLASWGRSNRYAGSGDRRAIADLVYDACRCWRSAAWAAGMPEGPRAALIGLCRLDGLDPDSLFTGERHAPPRLGAEERSPRVLDEAPEAVHLDIADWMLPRLGHVPREALLLMRERAPLDLRVNTLRSTREDAIARLAEDGIAAVPAPLSPTAIRVTDGARRVAGSRAYADGVVEVMDAASQAVADLCNAQPGETVIDWCAGAGGKTLALAASMQNRGRLIAHDADPRRLAQLTPRARRAGALVEIADGAMPLADVVLVDAPCSGSGTWRRNPETKWRLTEEDLAAFAARQQAILNAAAAHVRPDGRLVYATCSLFTEENGAVIASFLSERPEFAAAGAALTLTPCDGGDGFFSTVLIRN